MVFVIEVATSDKKAVKSPEISGNIEKQKIKHSTPVKKSSTDVKLEVMDQKWSEPFSRLEAFLLCKSLEKSELTFQAV